MPKLVCLRMFLPVQTSVRLEYKEVSARTGVAFLSGTTANGLASFTMSAKPTLHAKMDS